MDNFRYWKRQPNLLQLFLTSLWSNSDDQKGIIVLGFARTGSSLLLSYLDNLLEHSNNYGEVINPEIYPVLKKISKLPFSFKKYLALFKIQNALREEGLVKLLINHLERFEITPNDLHTHFPLAKFIIIYRSSLIDCYISWLRAKKTGEWFTIKDAVNAKGINLSIKKDEFINFCQKVKKSYIDYNLSALLEHSLVIEYEKLAYFPQEIFQTEICPFLNIDYQPVISHLKKQITEPLSNLITNFEEITQLIDSKNIRLEFDRHSKNFY
jgi:hypothetical protein